MFHGMGRRICAAGLAFVVAASGVAFAESGYVYPKGRKGAEDWTAARIWNEELLYGIRRDTARPVVHARNLFHSSVAMWDVWAAYDAIAEGYLVKEKLTPPGTLEARRAAREEAISYACYRLLTERFTNPSGQNWHPNSATILAHFDATFALQGFDKNNTSVDGNSPAAFGNRVGAAIIAWGLTDNSNEAANFAANNGYQPANPPLVVKVYGNACRDELGFQIYNEDGSRNVDCIDPNHWQPLALEFFIDQGGIAVGAYPSFIGPHWGHVTPFALRERDRSGNGVYLDPGAPPQFGTETQQAYIDNILTVIEASATLTPDDGILKDISPVSLGNNTVGTDDGTGYDINPVTNQPYQAQIVKRGDWARVIAEFWADGPTSETPPGHWNVLANYMSDLQEEKKIGGTGNVVDDLEWDVKLYLALNGAEHDAAVTCWGIKGYYDGVRPITGIRYLAELGQSSDPELPKYNPNGLPLIPGLIEMITDETTAPGQRHEHLVGEEGDIALLSWPNVPANPETQYSGVEWILAGTWVPYQRATFVTPPFAGYMSGHSTYSRSAAEVLTKFTGSPYFPGGIGSFFAEQNTYLKFEEGPSEDVVLEWATYYDAASEAGTSRIVGGIHWQVDNYTGQRVGQKIGFAAYHEAEQYWNGTVAHHSGDTNGDGKISLTELIRDIQLFNANTYGCAEAKGDTEDGYLPGIPGQVVLGECYPHDADYAPADFKFSLSELLRQVQFFNVGGYVRCNTQNAATEDGFCCAEE